MAMDDTVGQRWGAVEGFCKHEFAPPEDLDMKNEMWQWDMNYLLILILQAIRIEAKRMYGNSKVIIHKNGGFSYTGHAKTSLHYQGRAVDFHISVPDDVNPELPPTGLWRRLSVADTAILVYDQVTGSDYGIGLYSWGVHLDNRAGVSGRTDATWFRDNDGEYHFQRFNGFFTTLGNAISDNGKLTERV